MKILNLRIIDKGPVKASFDVYIPEWGLHILCTLLDKNGSKWISLPKRPFDHEGQVKYQWLTWFDKDMHKRFEEQVIKLIDAGQFEKAPDRAVSQAREMSVNEVPDDLPF